MKSYCLIDFQVILDIKLQVQKLAKYLEYFNMENEKKDNPSIQSFFFFYAVLWFWRKACLFYRLPLQSVMALQLCKAAKFSAELSEREKH